MEKSNMEKSKSVVPNRNPTKNPSKAQKAKAAKTFRSQNKGRNWTDLETETFAMILADSTHNFSFTLETKALKKSSNKEVFEVIQSEFQTALADPEFVKENNTYFPEESATDLDTSVQKLRTKYNKLKVNVETDSRPRKGRFGIGCREGAEMVPSLTSSPHRYQFQPR